MTEEQENVEAIPKPVIQTTLYKWFIPLKEEMVVALLSESRVLKNTFAIHKSDSVNDEFLLTTRSENRLDQIVIQCHRDQCKYSLGNPERIYFNTLSEIISNLITERVKIKIEEDTDLRMRHCFRNPIPVKKWFIAGKFDDEAKEIFLSSGIRKRFAVWMSKTGDFNIGITDQSVYLLKIHSHKRGYTLDTITFFGDIEQLISHYSRIPLSVQNNGYKKRLPNPFEYTGFYACMIGNRIEELRRFEDNSDKGREYFFLEFSDLENKSKRNSFSSTDALRPSSADKNRYSNVIAYDHTRVKITGTDDDYINASYCEVKIQLIKSDFQQTPSAYILSQAPMSHTIMDHWRMIIQQSIEIIIILTNLEEKGVVKCEKYWPDLNETMELYDGYKVTFIKEEKNQTTCFMDLIVKNEDIEFTRKIKIYHFLNWPDFGVPLECWGIIELISLLNLKKAKSPPQTVLVHCSAGVGRTGAFVIIDIILNQIRLQGVDTVIDIRNAVLTLRTQRPKLVTTVDQYKFIHLCILKYLEWRLGQSWFKLGYRKVQKNNIVNK